MRRLHAIVPFNLVQRQGREMGLLPCWMRRIQARYRYVQSRRKAGGSYRWRIERRDRVKVSHSGQELIGFDKGCEREQRYSHHDRAQA